jgi:hypothetical protein
MNVVSFYVHRPDHPKAVDYLPLLAALQRSCELRKVRHVVLTDAPIDGLECFVRPASYPLMRAVVELQSAWVREGDWRKGDTLFVGADCLIVNNPDKAFSGAFDMAVTYRPGHRLYPINTGTVLVRHGARKKAAALFDRVDKLCGERWGDDQRSIEQALSPMPETHGLYSRAGMLVAFLPMAGFNESPKHINQRVTGAVAHFKGLANKSLMVPWAEKWLR